jgi:hypothetical protein
MPRDVDVSMHERVTRHYQWCVRVLRAGDVEGFLDCWDRMGRFGRPTAPSSATPRPGRSGERRFGNVLAVRRFEIEIEDVAYNDDGLLVVDFHEQSELTVRGFDGTPAERDADLHNRNLWEVSEGPDDQPGWRGT